MIAAGTLVSRILGTLKVPNLGGMTACRKLKMKSMYEVKTVTYIQLATASF